MQQCAALNSVVVRDMSEFVREDAAQPALAKSGKKRIAKYQHVAAEAWNKGKRGRNRRVEFNRIEEDAVDARRADRLGRLADEFVEARPVLLAQLRKPGPGPLRHDGVVDPCRDEEVDYEERHEPDVLPRIHDAQRHEQGDDGEQQQSDDDALGEQQCKLETVESGMLAEAPFRALPSFPFPARDSVEHADTRYGLRVALLNRPPVPLSRLMDAVVCRGNFGAEFFLVGAELLA